MADGAVGADAPAGWDSEFAKEWLALQPLLANKDLRPVVYVSRDQVPMLAAADQLSPESSELLSGLLQLKTQKSSTLTTSLQKLPKRDVVLIMERLLVDAREVETWGVPPVLHACLTVIDADESQALRLAEVLRAIPGPRLNAAVVPLLGRTEWGRGVLQDWVAREDLSGPVRKAAEAELKPQGDA